MAKTKRSSKPGLVERLTKNRVLMTMTPEQFVAQRGSRYKKPDGTNYSASYLKRMYRNYVKGIPDTKTARGHNAGGKLVTLAKHHHTDERRISVPASWVTIVMNDPTNERGNWPSMSMIQSFIDRHKGNAFQVQAMVQLYDDNGETELFVSTYARHISGNYARSWWGDLCDLLLEAGPRSGTKSIAERIAEGETAVGLATFFIRADNPKPPTKKRRKKR